MQWLCVAAFVLLVKTLAAASSEPMVSADARPDVRPGLASNQSTEAELEQFSAYIRQFKKNYTEGEWSFRFAAFRHNLGRMGAHAQSNASFQLGLTVLADLTPEEFAARRKVGLQPPRRARARAANATVADGLAPEVTEARAVLDGLHLEPNAEVELPASVDWRDSGAVLPVQDQGDCGGCWAFAATAALSSAWKIATGQLEALSVQQLMDCTDDYGNDGCDGGNMENAFDYAQEGASLCSAHDYPYLEEQSSSRKLCRRHCREVIPSGAVVGFKEVVNSEKALMHAVSLQPVAVGLQADESEVFQLYTGGILSGVCGNNPVPNHAMLVVGYGTEDGKDYWLIRNSWGVDWGTDGYLKLARGPGPSGTGECGILDQPIYPEVLRTQQAAVPRIGSEQGDDELHRRLAEQDFRSPLLI